MKNPLLFSQSQPIITIKIPYTNPITCLFSFITKYAKDPKRKTYKRQKKFQLTNCSLANIFIILFKLGVSTEMANELIAIIVELFIFLKSGYDKRYHEIPCNECWHCPKKVHRIPPHPFFIGHEHIQK